MNDIRKTYRPKQLAKFLSISEVTLWRWRKAGYLPEPIKLGPKVLLWDSEVIDKWLKLNTCSN
jgi:prophage regulatory protein